MKVRMRIKPNLLSKVPNKQMPVGEYMVYSEFGDYEITEENVHHLESTCTKHWIEVVLPGEESKQDIVDEIEEEEEDEEIED